MALEAELLTTAEAAVVSGVEVRDVNRLIDEHILPEDLYVNEESRRVWAGSCALIRFYFGAADVLTASERKYAIDAVCREATTRDTVRLIRTWRSNRPNWRVEHGFLKLYFDRFIADTLAEHDKLTRARASVVEEPGILGGTPVIKGTRVPVYDIAASATAGIPRERIKTAYPSLTDEMIELAILYAKATPPRGRPRQTRKIAPGLVVAQNHAATGAVKFLIDECLSPELAQMARDRGHGESSHVIWIGHGGIKDWDLLPIVLDGDWTLVTRNSYDFRGPADAPGAGGQYQHVELHPGLICLNGPEGLDLEMQRELFDAALDEIDHDGDLVNKVLEVSIETANAEEFVIERYSMPEESDT